MDNSGPGTNIIWKIIGFVTAVCALGHRIYHTIGNYDSIVLEWGRFIYVFWCIYLIAVAAVVTPFTKGKLSLILPLTVISVSLLILCLDGIIFVAKLFDPSNRSMTEMGYFPFEYVLTCLSGVFGVVRYLKEAVK